MLSSFASFSSSNDIVAYEGLRPNPIKRTRSLSFAFKNTWDYRGSLSSPGGTASSSPCASPVPIATPTPSSPIATARTTSLPTTPSYNDNAFDTSFTRGGGGGSGMQKNYLSSCQYKSEPSIDYLLSELTVLELSETVTPLEPVTIEAIKKDPLNKKKLQLKLQQQHQQQYSFITQRMKRHSSDISPPSFNSTTSAVTTAHGSIPGPGPGPFPAPASGVAATTSLGYTTPPPSPCTSSSGSSSLSGLSIPLSPTVINESPEIFRSRVMKRENRSPGNAPFSRTMSTERNRGLTSTTAAGTCTACEGHPLRLSDDNDNNNNSNKIDPPSLRRTPRKKIKEDGRRSKTARSSEETIPQIPDKFITTPSPTLTSTSASTPSPRGSPRDDGSCASGGASAGVGVGAVAVAVAVAGPGAGGVGAAAGGKILFHTTSGRKRTSGVREVSPSDSPREVGRSLQRNSPGRSSHRTSWSSKKEKKTSELTTSMTTTTTTTTTTMTTTTTTTTMTMTSSEFESINSSGGLDKKHRSTSTRSPRNLTKMLSKPETRRSLTMRSTSMQKPVPLRRLGKNESIDELDDVIHLSSTMVAHHPCSSSSSTAAAATATGGGGGTLSSRRIKLSEMSSMPAEYFTGDTTGLMSPVMRPRSRSTGYGLHEVVAATIPGIIRDTATTTRGGGVMSGITSPTANNISSNTELTESKSIVTSDMVPRKQKRESLHNVPPPPPPPQRKLSRFKQEKGSVIYEETEVGNIVVAGSLNQLVSLLYSRKLDDSDANYVDTFLHVHPLILPSTKLFEKLVKAYKVYATEEIQTAQIQRMRIISVLKKWYKDFKFYPDLYKLYDSFVSELETQNDEAKRWAQYLKATQNLLTLDEDNQQVPLKYRIKPVVPMQKSSNLLSLINVDTAELARQMTLYDLQLFKLIDPIELLNLNWLKGKGQNVDKLIIHFTGVTDWIRFEVISDEQLKARVVKLRRSILLAEHLLEMQNFNSALAVYVGLELLRNLEPEWKKISQKAKGKWKIIETNLTMQRDFQILRKKFYHAEAPMIVPLSILLHDLVIIEEQPNLYHETSLCNFSKLRQIYGVYKYIEKTKSSIFGFESIPIIQEFIANHMKTSDVEERKAKYKEII